MQHHSKFSRLATGLVAGALAVTLAGCGLGGGTQQGSSPGASPDGAVKAPTVDCDIPQQNLDASAIDREKDLKGEIRFATQNLKTDFGDFFNNLIAEFEKEHPGVTIKWEDTPQAEDFDSRMVTDAQTCVMADVINVPGGTIASLSHADLLMNLDTKAPGIGERFIPDVWAASGLGNGGYHTALPWYWSPQVTTYNTGIFEEAGLDPAEPPANFEEQYEDSLQIVEKTNGSKQALWGNVKWNLLGLWLSHDVKVLDDNDRLVFADQEFPVEWLTKMADLYAKGAIPKDSVTGAPNPAQRYNEGTLAFGTSNASFLRNVKKNAPDLYGKTAVGPALQTNGKVIFDGQYVSVSVTTQNAPLALAWADYVTNAQNQLAWAKDPGVVIFPSTPESMKDPFFTDQDPNDPLGNARLVSASQVDAATVDRSIYIVTGRVLDTLLQEIQKAIIGEKDPKQALMDAQNAGNALLERANS